jgi:hypothetical protein
VVPPVNGFDSVERKDGYGMDLVVTVVLFLGFIGIGVLMLHLFPGWDSSDFPEYRR